MTEPPAPGPAEDAPATEAPAAEVAGAPEGPAPEPPSAGPAAAPEIPNVAWAAPPPARRRRGLLVAIGCGAILLAAIPVAVVALIFLGGQVQEILRGTVEFGTRTEGCTISGAASSFGVDVPVAYVAHLERQVPAGEAVTITLSFAGSQVDSSDQTFEAAADCVSGTLPASLLGPGNYRLEFTAGSEVLAAGEFDLTP